MSESKEVILEAKHVTRRFRTTDGRTLLANNDVNLKFYKGETLGLVGESGCGKSTFMKFLVSLDIPSEGEILYRGKDITKLKGEKLRQNRQNIQMVFQDPYASLNPRMSVFDIIAEPLLVHHLYQDKADLEKKVLDLLHRVGLDDYHANRYPHEFSGGQRQRVGIARALAVNPEFIVCDEPISALDVSIQAQVINMFEDLQEEMGLTYLFIAHDLSVVKHISDRIGVMYLGNMVELGSSDDVYKKPLHPYTRALISAAPIADPHLAKEKKRIILEGEVPSPLNPPAGCPFAGRCRYASESCRQKKPENYEYDNRKVACNLYSPENLAKYKAVGKTPGQILAE